MVFELAVIDPKIMITVKKLLSSMSADFKAPWKLEDICRENRSKPSHVKEVLLVDEEGLSKLMSLCGEVLRKRFDVIKVVREHNELLLLGDIASSICSSFSYLGENEVCKEVTIGLDVGVKVAVAVLIAGNPIYCKKLAFTEFREFMRKLTSSIPCKNLVIRIGRESFEYIDVTELEGILQGVKGKDIVVEVVPEMRTSRPLPLRDEFQLFKDLDLSAAINIALRSGVVVMEKR